MTTPSPSRPDHIPDPGMSGTSGSQAASDGGLVPASETAPVGDAQRSLTLSQDRLHVGTELSSAGSVRLEKYLVTETRTIEVQVTCERVRLIFTGPDGTQNVLEDPPATFHASPLAVDSSRSLFLHEEQPVVSKQWVPMERIRLDKYWIASTEAVTEDVRAEHVELTTDPAPTDPTDRTDPTEESDSHR